MVSGAPVMKGTNSSRIAQARRMSTRWLLARMHNGDQDCQAFLHARLNQG